MKTITDQSCQACGRFRPCVEDPVSAKRVCAECAEWLLARSGVLSEAQHAELHASLVARIAEIRATEAPIGWQLRYS